MINGFYKYSLTLVVVLSTSSLALAVEAAPNLGTAAATPTAGAAGTPKANGVSPQQNQTEQSNLRNIDAARRHQRDLEVARLEKEKAQVRAQLQKEQAALAQEEAKRQAVLDSLPAKRDKIILAEIAKTQEGMDEPTRVAFKDFIVKEYPKLATDTAEGNPLGLGAAATPEKVSEVISQFKVRMEIAESLKTDVASAAQNIGPEKAKAEGADGKKPEAAPEKLSLEEQRKAEEEMQKNFQANLRAIFKKSVGAKKASAPVTPEKIVGHVNALRDLASINRNTEPEQAKPGFHETPATAPGQ